MMLKMVPGDTDRDHPAREPDELVADHARMLLVVRDGEVVDYVGPTMKTSLNAAPVGGERRERGGADVGRSDQD